MNKNEKVQKDVQDAIQWKPLLNTPETSVYSKAGMNWKKFIYLTSLVGIGLFFSGCMGGFIATEPVYIESARPANPGNGQVWIDGNWVYSRQTHAYARRDGYWEKPNQGRVYVAGHWQTSPRGKYWVQGRWQRQGR